MIDSGVLESQRVGLSDLVSRRVVCAFLRPLPFAALQDWSASGWLARRPTTLLCTKQDQQDRVRSFRGCPLNLQH